MVSAVRSQRRCCSPPEHRAFDHGGNALPVQPEVMLHRAPGQLACQRGDRARQPMRHPRCHLSAQGTRSTRRPHRAHQTRAGAYTNATICSRRARSRHGRGGRRVGAIRTPVRPHSPQCSRRCSRRSRLPRPGPHGALSIGGIFLINVSMRIGSRLPVLELGGPSWIVGMSDALWFSGRYGPEFGRSRASASCRSSSSGLQCAVDGLARSERLVSTPGAG
jgi:hypothetical protein